VLFDILYCGVLQKDNIMLGASGLHIRKRSAYILAIKHKKRREELEETGTDGSRM
jgi:hypothetical protein